MNTLRPRIYGPILLALIISLPSVLRADDAVAKAVDKGAKYLREVHKPSQAYTGGSNGFGGVALCGLALLESGIGLDDPSLQNINKLVRSEAIRQFKTYEISLAIMYLDRMGERADRPIIQYLGLRLLAGQNRTGHWGYECGQPMQGDEVERFRTAIANDARLTTKDGPKKDNSDPKPRPDLPMGPNNPTAPRKDPPPSPNSENSALHPEAVRLAKLINVQNQVLGMFVGDNSNTQFAALALWISRKYGVPCDAALGGLAKSLRANQGRDGGWNYTPMPGPDSSPSMTCAGLIGLGVGYGTQMSALRTGGSKTGGGMGGAPVNNDVSIKAAIKLLAAYINWAKTRNAASGGAKRKTDELNQNLYLLWSMERVAVLYDLEKFGDHDWYAWGAEALIETQNADGSWSQNGYQGANAELNTAFALLFLNRANLAKDLTATLKGRANVKLPDRITNPEPVKVEPKQTPGPTVTSEFDAEANRLCNALVSADASKRANILAQLRDSKGSVFTEGLVRAILKLQGEQQREVREALAQRLKRMTAATLRDMLKDENRELRSAAAAACGLKEDKQYVPDLIAALADSDSMVVQSARTSLRNLSQKDFGPPPEATNAEKARAVNAWRAWWSTQQK